MNYVEKEYFDWLVQTIGGDNYSGDFAFDKLLATLHDMEFAFIISNDINRAKDGEFLRYRFVYERYRIESESYVKRNLPGPCSILEMMVALVLRCEETIMDDTAYGNRTSQWFWQMINSLGLSDMCNKNFDIFYVESVIATFINRDYERNGRGGLFTVYDSREDMRDLEIWVQLLRYLDTVTDTDI